MRICVYGASSTELDRKYTDATYELGRDIAKRGHGLVYGGGAQGVMGSTARGVRDGGGEVIGVTPEFFNVDGVVFPGMHAADLHKNHARAQADDGRSCGCVYRCPGWLWDI